MADNKVMVPAGFHEDFDLWCKRAGIEGDEKEEVRQAVRSDPDFMIPWIQDNAALYRFMAKEWGRWPTFDECKEYIRQKAHSEPSGLDGLGIMLVVKVCWRLTRQ